MKIKLKLIVGVLFFVYLVGMWYDFKYFADTASTLKRLFAVEVLLFFVVVDACECQ